VSDSRVRGERPASDGFGCGIDLRADGILWFINKHLFHPLGYALAFNEAVSAADATPDHPQFVLIYPDGEPVVFEDDLDREGRDLGVLAATAMQRARETLYAFSTSPIKPEPVGDAAGG
jgi:hypothetical protein